MSKRAELRRSARAVEKQEKRFWVSKSQLAQMVKEETRKALMQTQMQVAGKVMKIYEVAVSIALVEEGWGARGTRMKRFVDRVNGMIHRLSYILEKNKPEEIRAFCDELGIDYQDAFGIVADYGEVDMDGGEIVLTADQGSADPDRAAGDRAEPA